MLKKHNIYYILWARWDSKLMMYLTPLSGSAWTFSTKSVTKFKQDWHPSLLHSKKSTKKNTVRFLKFVPMVLPNGMRTHKGASHNLNIYLCCFPFCILLLLILPTQKNRTSSWLRGLSVLIMLWVCWRGTTIWGRS